jgi:hypothetical protein
MKPTTREGKLELGYIPAVYAVTRFFGTNWFRAVDPPAVQLITEGAIKVFPEIKY